MYRLTYGRINCLHHRVPCEYGKNSSLKRATVKLAVKMELVTKTDRLPVIMAALEGIRGYKPYVPPGTFSKDSYTHWK